MESIVIWGEEFTDIWLTIWGEHSLGMHGTTLASLHKHSPPKRHRDVEGYDSEIPICKHDSSLIWKHIGLLTH